MLLYDCWNPWHECTEMGSIYRSMVMKGPLMNGLTNQKGNSPLQYVLRTWLLSIQHAVLNGQ